MTAFLYNEIGLAGLLPLLGVSCSCRVCWCPSCCATPRSGTSASGRPQPATRAGWPRCSASAASQRRILRDAATHLGGRARLTRLDDFDAVMQTVLYSHEHWTGTGGLGLCRGEDIPVESRVLAVAHAWAALTAQGGPGLTPREALVNLRVRAGQELDPWSWLRP